MNVLVTGHLGFMGRNLWRRLQADGHDLRGVDLKEGDDCRDFFRATRQRFDLVIHCAALVGGRLTIEGAPLSVATDLSIDSEMFNWALDTGQARIVYFSSSAAYPTRLQTSARRLTEADIDLNEVSNPDMTYGWSKLTGEYLASFAVQAGLPVHVFRPFSGYGPDQDLDYPFPSFIQRAARREDPFEIWGDGEQVRDFIHVDDLVEAVLTAVERDILGPVNLGSGEPTSFNDLARIVCEEAGYQPRIRHLRDKPAGVRYRCCDPTLMHTFHRPRVSLREGVRRALAQAAEAGSG